jgi:hypothetical protein
MRLGQMRDTSVASREMRQDAAAGWIRQGSECAIQGTGRIFNHLVKYSAPSRLKCKSKNLRFFLNLKNETKLSNPQARGRGGLLTTPFFDINSRAGARSLDNNEP